MPPLKWTPQSMRDVARVHGFLASRNKEAAQRAIQAIVQGVWSLGKFPEAGRPVEKLPDEFRQWTIEFGGGAYVAHYYFDSSEVVILAIRRGREASDRLVP